MDRILRNVGFLSGVLYGSGLTSIFIAIREAMDSDRALTFKTALTLLIHNGSFGFWLNSASFVSGLLIFVCIRHTRVGP